MALILPKVLVVIIASILSTCNAQTTFTNPILDGNAADPFVTHLGDFYYMTLSTDFENSLTIYKSSELTDFRNTVSARIFQAPQGFANVWASELHRMGDGQLYIYFAMNKDGETHRMYAIKADDPENPMGTWGPPIRMLPNIENPAVDGTPFKTPNGKTYFVWSGRGGDLPFDSILMAEMVDPVTTLEGTVVLREPLLPWERYVNEGPFMIYNKNVSYLIFSASFTFSEYYCLGLMSIEDGKDPMVVTNWDQGDLEGPVFYSNPEDNVYGPGHAAFTTSPDGSETWLIYHGASDKERIERHRIARIDRIEWDSGTGRPIFPRPKGYFTPQPVPSGQVAVTGKTTFTNPIFSGDSPDPAVFKFTDGYYYLPLSTHGSTSITLYRSRDLTNFRNAESIVALPPTDCISDVWAPQMHQINGELYIYVSYRDCSLPSGRDHNMYVMKANQNSDPMGTWASPFRLLLQATFSTADPTILQHGDGNYYIAFESQAQPYGLYIARMNSAVNVDFTSLAFLKGPEQGWEGGVTNAPFFFSNAKGTTYMTYSGGNPMGGDYSVGLMSIGSTDSPLLAANWKVKDGPVFSRNDAEGVYATGHATFTTSPDGTETWMTYHGAEYPDDVFGNRIARVERIEWDSAGEPIFPRPHGYFNPQPLPSGQRA